jgi:hypothetical protein
MRMKLGFVYATARRACPSGMLNRSFRTNDGPLVAVWSQKFPELSSLSKSMSGARSATMRLSARSRAPALAGAWPRRPSSRRTDAIEMAATVHLWFQIRKAEAAEKGIRYPIFTRQDYYLPPEFAAPRRFTATTGISVTRDGVDHSEDVSLAARNALLNTIDHLCGRGWTAQQAHVTLRILCSWHRAMTGWSNTARTEAARALARR